MTTEVKKRPINRLQSMYALRALSDQMYEATREAQELGKPVAWCMQESFASPFLNAIGMESVYPENFGTVCAATGAAQAFLERSDAEGFPTHLCGYAQNHLGYTARMMDLGGKIPPEAPQGGLPMPTLLVSSGMGCDARFKWFQALGRWLDAPVWTIEFPPMGLGRENLNDDIYEEYVDFFIKELKEFAAFLENLLGRKMDWDILGADIDNMMAMDKVWWEVNELRKVRPGPMHSRDFWSSMSASLFRTTNPKAVTDLYQKMHDEVKYRMDNKISAINTEEKYRMTFIGLPPWHALNFFDKLAERGWNFVTELAYHPPRPVDLSGYSDPVERLVRYRYQGLNHQIDSSFTPEDGAQIKDEIKRLGYSSRLQAEMVKEFQCDGAFLHPLLTCRTATAGLFSFQYQAMEVCKVPSLIIEGDIVDTRLFDPVEALKKAEAFEETMDHYKQVRKEAGLEW